MHAKLTAFIVSLCLAAVVLAQYDNAARPAQIYGLLPGEEISAPATYDNSASSLKLIRQPADRQEAVSAAPEAMPSAPLKPAAETAPLKQPVQPASAAVPPPQHLQRPAAGQKKPRPRDKVKWSKKSSGNFTVYSQPRMRGVPTPNLNLKFETVHQILRLNIPWLVAGKGDVYVYQTKADFLKYEPRAQSWSGALFIPDDNCIVVYDDTKESKNLISQFTHELTHLFFEGFFNPPAGKAPPAEPPIWLNEGLAVNMEDISANYKGGVWADDLILYNIHRPDAAAANIRGAGGRLRGRAPPQ